MAVVAGGVGLTLAGRAFNVAVVFVPGVGLVLLGVLVPAWIWISARAADVTRTLPKLRVTEGEPFEVRLQLTGRTWVPGTEVVDPVAGSMIARGGRPVTLTASFERRGRTRLDPPRLRMADPLGLVQVSRSGSCGSQEVLVLPQTDPVSWVEYRGGASGDSARRTSDEPWGASEVDGLREYRPGTPASRIHWPALARGAGLLERRLRADGAALPVVVLDPRADGRLDLLDAAVRAAASLVLELGRRSGCELALPGERRPLRVGRDLAAWPEAHARLALVEDDGPAAAVTLPRGGGAIFYVAASRPGEVALPASRQGRQTFVLVLPRELCERVSGAVRFSVAGCRGLWLEHQTAAMPTEWVA